ADDVAQAPVLLDQAECDRIEAADPTSAAYAAARQPGVAAAAEAALTVAVDVTWLGPYQTGAQVLTTAAIEALAARPEMAEVLLFGLDSLPGYAAHLSRVPGVRLIGSPQTTTEHTAPGRVIQQRADIVWYPNQIDHRSNISAARELGARVVTTYLDLIAYDIPRYHGSAAAWHAYRRLQRRIALSCDGITAISADVANRLLQEVPRLEPERVLDLPLGLDHIAVASTPAEPDADLDGVRAGLKGHDFVLVLGNDFQHKNRDLAIRAWQRAMQSGRPEHLVLAGLHVRSSSSQQAEEAALADVPGLRDRVHLVGHVSPASRQWLLAHAMAVMYPSSAEGFGFVPYEAAVLGTASVFGDFGPLKEISGASGLPNGWSVQAHTDDLARLLADPAAGAARISQLQRAIAARTWADFAADLVAFFRHIRELPQAATSVLGSEQTAEAAQLNAILSSRAYRATQRLKRALGR
ncbi:MAG: glycosyltransferase, partial [Cyanobacteria bacterium REEB417]|nr:glycosyltransferase [Cyanobacteria bacterium REEB417]